MRDHDDLRREFPDNFCHCGTGWPVASLVASCSHKGTPYADPEGERETPRRGKDKRTRTLRSTVATPQG